MTFKMSKDEQKPEIGEALEHVSKGEVRLIGHVSEVKDLGKVWLVVVE